MDRRRFLSQSLALGCSAAASPLLTPVAFASAPWENRLVVILLRGAMDGLDAVRPVGDRDFAALRPGLTEGSGHTDLTGFFALHEGFDALLPLWQAGELSFAHAVSTPYRDKRSHFDGQDMLEAGIAALDQGVRDGWLNRMLASVPGLEADIAYAVGQESMLILQGPAPVSSWSPEVDLTLSPATEALMEHVFHSDPLFRDAGSMALRISDEVAEFDEMGAETVGRGVHVDLAQFAASRLVQETRIAAFSIGGWDTHRNQSGALRGRLRRLSDAILTLKAGLGPDVWGKTTVLCMTEFGRTARENGNAGTDHGTGGAMVLAGGAVRGGRVEAEWPGLSEADLYARRDLTPTRDVRAHAAWTMRHLFGLPVSTLEQAVFPGLDMGTDPGLML